MAGFIEEFYNGNIEPHSRDYGNRLAVFELAERLKALEEALKEQLEGDTLQSFLDFLDASVEMNLINDSESFVAGFRYGARFAYDAFAM